MTKMFWNPNLADHEIIGNAMKRLKKAGEAMADEVRKNTPVGTVSRPMYKRGDYAGQYWTARDAGALKRSVRVAVDPKFTGGMSEWVSRNVWVMVGTKAAYYGKIVEFGVNGNEYQGFFRKAINRSKKKASKILTG